MKLYLKDIKEYAFQSDSLRVIRPKTLYYDGINHVTSVSNMSWRKQNQFDLDGRGYHACVYFLIEKEEVVYIGQTTNEYRVRNHEKDKSFDDVWFFPTKAPYQIILEEKLLSKYKTKYNKRYFNRLKNKSTLDYYTNKRRVTPEQIKNLYLSL